MKLVIISQLSLKFTLPLVRLPHMQHGRLEYSIISYAHSLQASHLHQYLLKWIFFSVGCNLRSSGTDHDLLLLHRHPRAVEVQQEHGPAHQQQQHSQARSFSDWVFRSEHWKKKERQEEKKSTNLAYSPRGAGASTQGPVQLKIHQRI